MYTDGTVNRVEVDGHSLGPQLNGTGDCGGLILRVWGGATAYFDHIAITHAIASAGS
jgi:hypothetical protein